MHYRFYVRVHRRDGLMCCSPFFDSFEEADRWKQTVRREAILVAVIVAMARKPREPDVHE